MGTVSGRASGKAEARGARCDGRTREQLQAALLSTRKLPERCVLHGRGNKGSRRQKSVSKGAAPRLKATRSYPSEEARQSGDNQMPGGR